MAAPRKRYSEAFKRQIVAQISAEPSALAAIARETGVSYSTLYVWRKQYAAPLPDGDAPGAEAASEGEEAQQRAAVGPDASTGAPVDHDRLRQTLLAAAFALAHAIASNTDSAPLNQLSAALGIVIDRLLRLEALSARSSASPAEEVISIEYLDPDGTRHSSPPWARGDTAFEETISRGRVRSPFWEDGDGQADDPGDGPARG
jgi:transposase-like protein